MYPISSTSCHIHFRKSIRPLSTAHTQALLGFLESLSITISLPHSTPSEFEVEIWSHCQLNKFDEKRNVVFPFIHCQKYRKPFQKDFTFLIASIPHGTLPAISQKLKQEKLKVRRS